MKKLDKEGLRGFEQLYDIKFSDAERKILLAEKWELHGLEKQAQFLLVQALAPIACPACTGTTCLRAAAVHRDDHGHGRDDNDYACQICKTRLTYSLGITGMQWFTIQPGQTVTIPERG